MIRRLISEAIEKAIKRVDGFWTCTGWMTHRGVKVVHVGTPINQVAVAKTVDFVGRKLAEQIQDKSTLKKAMSRTWVIFRPGTSFEHEGAKYSQMVSFEGIFSRPVVTIAAEHPQSAQKLASGLASIWGAQLGLTRDAENVAQPAFGAEQADIPDAHRQQVFDMIDEMRRRSAG